MSKERTQRRVLAWLTKSNAWLWAIFGGFIVIALALHFLAGSGAL